MKSTVSKEFSFCYAHRIEGHPKCGRLHGHNARVIVSVKDEIKDDGMVIDFGILKDLWVAGFDREWDHRFLSDADDSSWRMIFQVLPEEAIDMFGLEVHNVVTLGFPTTAENLAEYIATKFYHILFEEKRITPDALVMVEFFETPTASAKAIKGPVVTPKPSQHFNSLEAIQEAANYGF